MPDNVTPNRDELDILIDSALATYIDEDPSPHVTSRILASTKALHRRPSLRLLRWITPALAAVLLITILLIHRPGTHRESSSQPAELSTSRAPAPAVLTANAHTASTVAEETAHRRLHPLRTVPAAPPLQPLPRQEVFPTPAPLTPQEQALLMLANSNSQKLAEEAAKPAAQPQPIEPLHIAAIHIPPLNPPDNGNN